LARIYITPCSKEKEESYRLSGDLAPPDLLYTSGFIQGFMQRCKTKRVRWAIFSDLYGIWFPEIERAWYEKDPATVSEDEYSSLLRGFDERLEPYEQIWFYYDPNLSLPLHKRLLNASVLRDRIRRFTDLSEIA